MNYTDIISDLMDAPATLPHIFVIEEKNKNAGGYMWADTTNRAFRDKASNWTPHRTKDGKLVIQRNGAKDSSPNGKHSAHQVRGVYPDWRISSPVDDGPEQIDYPKKARKTKA